MKSVAKVLKNHLKLLQLKPYLDGGDILSTPEAVYVGLTNRTDAKAAKFLSKQICKKMVSKTKAKTNANAKTKNNTIYASFNSY